MGTVKSRITYFFFSYFSISCLRARLHDERKIPAFRKILQGEPTFGCVYMQKFRYVRLTVEKELKIKDYPLNDVWFVPSTRIFLVVGYSYLSARKILVVGSS